MPALVDHAELHKHPAALVQLHERLEGLEERQGRPHARLRQLPPSVQQPVGTLADELLGLGHAALLESGSGPDHEQAAGVLELRLGAEGLLEGNPVRDLPQVVHHRLRLVHVAREIDQGLPLVQLLGAVGPKVDPKRVLAPIPDRGRLVGSSDHGLVEDLLALLVATKLNTAQPSTGLGHHCPLLPQPVQEVVLVELLVELRKGVEAAGLLLEQHDMRFQQGDRDVPCVVGLSEELDELRRDLRLRLTEGDALEQRLDNVRPRGTLS
mmetsp:Transcript_42561/g.101034  ORF Transcript_42561/g.101034 Transcript_42561/m.101034 type:complete len:267 (+) Transcript_42561:2964-3764(+)